MKIPKHPLSRLLRASNATLCCLALAGCLPTPVLGTEESVLKPVAVWITPGFYSLHFDRNSDLRNPNPGLGIQLDLKPPWSLAVGHFRNSNDRPSNYLGALYMPVSQGPWRAGLSVAAFDGYPSMRDGGWFISVIPTLGIYGARWGLNVGIIPELKERVHGALSLQLLLRLH